MVPLCDPTMVPLINGNIKKGDTIVQIPIVTLVSIFICIGIVVIGLLISLIIACRRRRPNNNNITKVEMKEFNDSEYDGLSYEEDNGMMSKVSKNKGRQSRRGTELEMISRSPVEVEAQYVKFSDEDIFNGQYYEEQTSVVETGDPHYQNATITPGYPERLLENDEIYFTVPKQS